jgi:C-terminal processing protease CtpA/Prc
MTLATCRTKAIALVAASMLAATAIAQQSGDASNGGQQSGDQQQSSSAKSNENQQQNQASENQNTENAKQDQDAGQKNEATARSDRDAQATDRDDRGSRDNGARSAARDERDSNNRQSDTRADSRERSNQYENRDRQRDDRERSVVRSNDDRSQDRDAQRGESRRDMRAPDMGIWFDRSSRNGLVISDVSNRGPIAKLGFHEGDRIVSVNGKRVNSESEFMRFVFHSNVNRVPVVIVRDGREETIYIEPAVFTEDYNTVEVNPLERFGIILDDRYDDRIVVWRVIPRSPAYYAGFRPGDVIATFSGHPYRTRTEFERSASTWKPGEVNVQVRRGDRNRDLTVDVPILDRSERSARRTERVEQRQSDRIQRDSNDINNRNENYQDNRPDNRQENRRGILNGGVLRGRSNR